MAKERWASRMGLVLAMAGNAVGLGNFLRFPAQAAKNGGGAFLVPYLVALLVMGLPLIWVEWTMGRYGGQLGHHSTPGIFQSMGRHPMWKYLGVFGLWTNLIIAAYYLYIETWTMAFAGYSLIGGFGKPGESGKKFHEYITGEMENEIIAISGVGLALFFICIAINIFILSRGLAKGIEIVSKIGMPLLIFFGMILAIRGLMISPETDEKAVSSPLVGLNFVWEPKYDKLTSPSVWLAAAGQIFFTLSVGMGSAHCYASYLREQDDVTLTGATASWTNEFCEVILGGSILLPIAVAYQGLAAVQAQTAELSGLELGFHVFPMLFQNWGAFAPLAGFMWFALLFFAAITSSLAMGQPVMAFLQADFGLNRRASALVFGAMLLPLAAAVACFHSSIFFTEFDYWVGSFALVVMALIESILFAWVFGMDRGWAEMLKGADLQVPRVFYYILKYITPVFLMLILVGYVFQPKAGWDTYVNAVTKGVEAPRWEWDGDGMIGKLLYVDVPIDPADPPEKQRFNEQVRFWRTIDRLILVGTFVGFSLLVAVAWKKRLRV
jgi:NSS family neurotransmitter:Na+ symporter